jgi:hypothetical protein
MSELVNKLSARAQKIETNLRPENTPRALRHCVEQGYVNLKFCETQGGTYLYVPLDKTETDTSGADFEGQHGTVKLAGKLVLDYVAVRCVAQIDLATMQGEGQLQLLA